MEVPGTIKSCMPYLLIHKKHSKLDSRNKNLRHSYNQMLCYSLEIVAVVVLNSLKKKWMISIVQRYKNKA
jgi:hypothetical protein